MKVKCKKIGIWGFGKVGKSVARFYLDKYQNKSLKNEKYKNITLEILDQRKLTNQEKLFIQKNNIRLSTEVSQFLERNDVIIASPGVHIKPYMSNKKYAHKFISELDLFQEESKNQDSKIPVIAVTGSVGKTTVVHFLDQILNAQNIKTWTGGNIGTPVLDMFQEQRTSHGKLIPKLRCILLELSSFQLESIKTFTPDLAIWTNFHPNHLDRHENIETYFLAKANVLTSPFALVPFSILKKLKKYNIMSKKTKVFFFSERKPTSKALQELGSTDTLFFLETNKIIKWTKKSINSKQSQVIIDLTNKNKSKETFFSTFLENLFIIFSALYIFNKKYALSEAPLSKLDLEPKQNAQNPLLERLEHRLEKVTSINGVTFYNDSKATTGASTLAALKKLSGVSKDTGEILLILGGLSKGIDRGSFIKKIKKFVKQVIIFGNEAQNLQQMCQNAGITCECCKTLDATVQRAFTKAIHGDIVLFSPSGSSFDLFENYQARGKHFKHIVWQLSLLSSPDKIL